MKKACSVCLSNCLRLHGAQGENEDVGACLQCALRKSEGEHQNQQRTQAERNPSFLKKMAKSTMSTLKLPLSFVRGQIDRLDGSVILEGPSNGKWRVELQGSFQSFSLNFGQGWETFVADHVLQVDDLLTFSLSAKSYFQVEVYDGGGCLKTSALDAEVAEAARPVAKVVQAARSVAARPVGEVGEPAMSVAGVAETEVEPARSVAEVAEKSEGLDGPDLGDGLIKLADNDRELLPEHHVVRGSVLSRRPPVTELEKERALQAAKSLELANPNILLVMSKQNVYKGFWLGIPKQFAKEWMPSGNNEVKIVNKGGHSWPAKWIAGRGGLSSGWRRFSLDHRLEEHDVCVLELIDKANYVLLVHIFRVLWSPGEDLGLYPHTLSPDKRNKRKSFNCHEADGTLGEAPQRKSSRRSGHKDMHTLELDSATKTLKHKTGLPGHDMASPGNTAVLTSGGAEEQGETRAAEGTPTAAQDILTPISFGQGGHEADSTPGEGSERKRKRSRRDVQVGKRALEPGSAIESLKRKRWLLDDDKASPAKGKESATLDHGEIGTSDAELLVNFVQKSVVQVSSKNRAGGAGDEVALRAGEPGAKVEPQPVLALICYENGSGGDYEFAEHSSSARADFSPEVHYNNPDDVHEQIIHVPVAGLSRGRKKEKRQDDVHGQIVHVPATGPFRGRKNEKRQEYKVVHIYGGRNFGNGTEFLTELEGYSEGESFAYLDRDDDTGFWWVPYEQFGWDMMRCYIG